MCVSTNVCVGEGGGSGIAIEVIEYQLIWRSDKKWKKKQSKISQRDDD